MPEPPAARDIALRNDSAYCWTNASIPTAPTCRQPSIDMNAFAVQVQASS